MSTATKISSLSRRHFVQSTVALAALGALGRIAPASPQNARFGRELRVGGDRIGELEIARTPFGYSGRQGTAVTINGTVPGPLLRFREGETATLRVTNRLDVTTSVHWHGLLVPSDQDGVPGLSFPGIGPGETFTYRFPVRQSGTYWYHSHSGFQEQQGHYAPIIIEPMGRDPVAFDREYVVQVSDWTFQDPDAVFARLKKKGNYFNFQRRTTHDLVRDVKDQGLRATLQDRLMWAQMRMDPTDILDVTGFTYTYLMNGAPPGANWTALFRAGERVRLRFINSGAQTYFNVRIPGLPMTVVQADGQNVQPVTVDEFQFGAAETYDVVVQPTEERAYTIFAEAMDRSGYARGTLAPREGMTADVPALRERPLRSMVDMGMDMAGMDMPGMDMPGMQHGGTNMAASAKAAPAMQSGGMALMNHSNAQAMGATAMPSKPSQPMGSMDSGNMQGLSMKPSPNAGAHAGMSMPSMPGMDQGSMQGMEMSGMGSPVVGRHSADTHGPANTTVAMVQRNRLGEPGTGLENTGHRVLTYNDLKSLEPAKDTRAPGREIEMHLTGNMELFIWGIDGKKFSEAPGPVTVSTGERVRITLVNDTMMEHPMHLHGVFMELDNGAGAHKPRKHTITVKPAERLSFDFTYDEPGNFAFHCHMLLHMEAGMFRFFNVSGSKT